MYTASMSSSRQKIVPHGAVYKVSTNACDSLRHSWASKNKGSEHSHTVSSIRTSFEEDIMIAEEWRRGSNDSINRLALVPTY